MEVAVTLSSPTGTFVELPDPGGARDLDELVERLRSLKVWAGEPVLRGDHGPDQRRTGGGRPLGR
jgi:hypothetical protein